MKITGITSPWIFRTCTFVIALIGIFFLYKLSFQITKSFVKSLFVTSFALTSPIYAYYFNGFIPSIPELTFAIISLYFYVKYFDNVNNKSFTLSIAFLTLSVLIRSSFAVTYVALLCFEFLRIIRKESTFRNKIIPILTSFLLIFTYYLWNKHIANLNGTLFLTDLMPSNDWNDFWHRMTKAKDNWQYHYFGKIHYYSFIVIVVIAMLSVCLKKFKSKEDHNCKRTLPLYFLIIIMFFAYALFTLAMGKQFPNHDYYFIDTYFLPLLISLILILKSLPIKTNYFQKTISVLISSILIVFMLINVKEMQQKRRAKYWGEASERTIKNYQGSEEFLDSMNVSKGAKILTLYSYPQNTPFILMNRKGYTLMDEKDLSIETALSFDYDYVIVEKEIYDKKYKGRSELFFDLKYVSDNGKIMLFVKGN
ncbi:MAG: glycosyltransferase family 39 protein [Bacteroidales bacterium]|nr:glycosyltransferase family 39 protein [Bacteroidales bacterium]